MSISPMPAGLVMQDEDGEDVVTVVDPLTDYQWDSDGQFAGFEDQCHVVGGWWINKSEKHLTGVMAPGSKRHKTVKGRWHYQHHKLEMALKHVPEGRRRLAVDIGAHVGLFAYHMVDHFRHVHCFEPMPIHQYCLLRNMASESNWTLHPQGLSKECGIMDFHFPTDTSGDAHVATPDGKKTHMGKEEILTIKDVYVGYLDQFNFGEVDFIKIDVEGHELEVCQGAEETLRRCKPVMLIEQKGMEVMFYGQKRDAAISWLNKLGMRSIQEWSGDHVMVWA